MWGSRLHASGFRLSGNGRGRSWADVTSPRCERPSLRRYPDIFFGTVLQNLGCKGVTNRDMGRPGQNLGTKGLTGKILQNKDLGANLDTVTTSTDAYLLEAANDIFLIVFFSDFSVKVVCHTNRYLTCGKRNQPVARFGTVRFEGRNLYGNVTRLWHTRHRRFKR